MRLQVLQRTHVIVCKRTLINFNHKSLCQLKRWKIREIIYILCKQLYLSMFADVKTT